MRPAIVRQNFYFLLAAFVVSAALWRAGVPAVPIALGIVMAGIFNWRRNRKAVSVRP